MALVNLTSPVRGQAEAKRREALYEPAKPLVALSQTEKVLAAAKTLPQPFSKSELVVAAWRRWPENFALSGFEQFPDSNKILSCLYGAKGLLALGRVRPDGTGMFTTNATEEGEEAE